MGEQATAAVWPPGVRLLHWTLVLALGLTTLSLWRLGWLHQPAGYLALAAAAVRIAWGAAGRTRRVRFADFVRSPRATWAHLRLVLQRREPRHLGHNPLGGWMVLALLACVAGLGLTGWLYTSDALWGDETVERAHRALAWTLLGLVLLHLAGVAGTGWRHRENLVAAMCSGRKRAPAPGDIA